MKVLWKKVVNKEALEADQKPLDRGRLEYGSAEIAEKCMKYFKDKFIGPGCF